MILFGDVRTEVHGSGVVPEEEWLVRLGLRLHPVERLFGDLLVDGFHALLGQRTGIDNRLSSLAIGLAVEHAARPELLLERRVLGVIRQFRFFLGVEVIKIAEEFVEAMHRREEFVAVAEVVLAELAGGIALRLEQFGDSRIFLLQADRRAGHTDLGQSRTNWILSADEARAPGGAALLRIVVGEGHALFRNAVDVRCAIAHHAATEMADVPDADVVTPQNQDVRFLCCHDVFLSVWVMAGFLQGTQAGSAVLPTYSHASADSVDRTVRCMDSKLRLYPSRASQQFPEDAHEQQYT